MTQHKPPQDFQDELFGAIERANRDARTDKVTGGILTGEEVIQQILAAFAIPPEMLGEMSSFNHYGGESQRRIYEQQLFRKKKR